MVPERLETSEKLLIPTSLKFQILSNSCFYLMRALLYILIMYLVDFAFCQNERICINEPFVNVYDVRKGDPIFVKNILAEKTSKRNLERIKNLDLKAVKISYDSRFDSDYIISLGGDVSELSEINEIFAKFSNKSKYFTLFVKNGKTTFKGDSYDVSNIISWRTDRQSLQRNKSVGK